MSFDEKPLKLISLIIIIDTVDGFVNMIVGKAEFYILMHRASRLNWIFCSISAHSTSLLPSFTVSKL